MTASESLPEPAAEAASEPPAEPSLRARILNAAFAAFAERGYRGASTLEIATRAKVSKRELYALFGSKQAMLRAGIAQRAKHMLPAEPPPPARDRRELAATLTLFGQTLLIEVCHPASLAVHRLAVAEGDHSPEIGQELEAVRAAKRAAIVTLFRDALARGLVAAGDPDAMAGQFLSLLWGDLLVRILQRAAVPPTPDEARAKAAAAAAAILALHPAK